MRRGEASAATAVRGHGRRGLRRGEVDDREGLGPAEGQSHALLGHASASMTLDVYADLFDDDLDGVAVAMDAARLREVVPKTCPLPG